ncbi:MAG TPA: hypothetical protein VEJ47_08235 [Candidatus Eremiobacteraceae bacterium]|nr:hypothetical protein [Candidatus Eremiobacteraceae bacterium]
MRKLVIAVSLFFLIAAGVSAHQRAAAPAPAPMVARPAPSAPAAAGHVAPSHTPVRMHTGTHGAPVRGTQNITRKSLIPPGSSLPVPPPLGGAVNSVTAYPGVGYCHPRFGGFAAGLNACPPNNGVVLPFSAGAIYIPIPYYGDYGAPPAEQPEQPSEEAANQPPDYGPRPNDYRQPEQEPSAAQVPYRSNANDINESLSEFVFVQRDGSKLFAVAYSFTNDKLHYVTKEGIRRTLPVDSLDLDATQKINENLGNTINFPTPALSSGVALNAPPPALP